jgi:hypothetical protein
VQFITRLKNTSAYDAQEVIDAGLKSFANGSEGFVFAAFGEGATNENPWYQEANDRTHFAVSESFFNLVTGLGNIDPRGFVFFDEGFDSTPAPNGSAELDQGGDLYTKMYDYVTADAPIPFYTYDQLMFDMAEAYLSLGQNEDAKTALDAGTRAAMVRQLQYGKLSLSFIVVEDDPETEDVDETITIEDLVDSYVADVSPAAGSLTDEDIWDQNYISLYPYQSIEAYAFYRRTDHPNLTNPNGEIPRRFPYPQSEIDNNKENVPSVQPSNGVWWDDLSE